MKFGTTQLTCKCSPETTISSIPPGIYMQVLSYTNSCENLTQSALEWVLVSIHKFKSLLKCYDSGSYSTD